MGKRYDYIVIGGGSGGIASVNRAASYGKRCLLIEANALGGTCVNVGCVPKKVMWNAAQVADAMQVYGPDYGFAATVQGLDWGKLVANRSAYIARIHASYESVLRKHQVEVVRGVARLCDDRRVEVNGEIHAADHVLIATGGRPVRPTIPGAEFGIDSDGFFALPGLPWWGRGISLWNWPGCCMRWGRRRTCSCASTRRCGILTPWWSRRWSKLYSRMGLCCTRTPYPRRSRATPMAA